MNPTRHLSYANVASTLAVVLALGGGGAAVAASLGKNTVGSKQLKPAAVKLVDLAPDAVDGSRIVDDAVTGADVAESTLGKVPSAAIADLAATATSATTATTATTAANVLRATVAADGTLVAAQSSAGTTTVSPADGPGRYVVVFPRDITTCTAVADVTAPGVGVPAVGTAGTTRYSVNAKGVYVATRDKNGDAANLAFALLVVC